MLKPVIKYTRDHCMKDFKDTVILNPVLNSGGIVFLCFFYEKGGGGIVC